MFAIEPLGDEAYVMRELGAWEAYDLSEEIGEQGWPGLVEAVAAYDTVGLYVEPQRFDLAGFQSWLAGLRPGVPRARRTHVVPVCYEMGEDLAEVCERLSLTQESLAALHGSIAYRCYAVGFSPGFPYLGYLPEPLCGLPRRAEPRVRVPAGSVAITGRQTAVYPQESPGGWFLIGRTPMSLVVVAEEYFPIAAGDLVRFEAIDVAVFESLRGKRL